MPRRRRLAEVAEDDESPEPSTQRRRTGQNDSEDEDSNIDSEEDVSTQDNSTNEMVKKLVRLALACEFQRRPIRKVDIAEKALGTNSRQFRTVFEAAQSQLRNVFGMEMTELPAKEKVTVQQRRAAQKTAAAASSQSKPVPSWILTSILPEVFRQPPILQPPSAPTVQEDAEYTGIYTILISYIGLSGGSITDAKMTRVLKKLRLDETTPLHDQISHREHLSSEKMLAKLVRDGYIVRNKDSTGTGEDDITWTIGPRGKTEVGNNGVKGLTKTVWGDLDTTEEEEELEKKIARSLGLAERPPTTAVARTAETAPARRTRKTSRRPANGTDRANDEDDDDDDKDDASDEQDKDD